MLSNRINEPPTKIIISDAIWVIICVDVGGVLGVTQQLNSSSFDFHNSSSQSDGPISNPFNMGMV